MGQQGVSCWTVAGQAFQGPSQRPEVQRDVPPSVPRLGEGISKSTVTSTVELDLERELLDG